MLTRALLTTGKMMYIYIYFRDNPEFLMTVYIGVDALDVRLCK